MTKMILNQSLLNYFRCLHIKQDCSLMILQLLTVGMVLDYIREFIEYNNPKKKKKKRKANKLILMLFKRV